MIGGSCTLPMPHRTDVSRRTLDMGQKQTLVTAEGMSALSPKADIHGASCMSALCHKETSPLPHLEAIRGKRVANASRDHSRRSFLAVPPTAPEGRTYSR